MPSQKELVQKICNMSGNTFNALMVHLRLFKTKHHDVFLCKKHPNANLTSPDFNPADTKPMYVILGGPKATRYTFDALVVHLRLFKAKHPDAAMVLKGFQQNIPINNDVVSDEADTTVGMKRKTRDEEGEDPKKRSPDPDCRPPVVEEDTYWNDRGKYQKEFDELCEKLVPTSGKCDTVAGEILRAASKLLWDINNNGVGWNNTSGALNYLIAKKVVNSEEVEELYPCTRKIVIGDVESINKKMYPMVNAIIDMACEFIHNNPIVIKEKNTEDIWNYAEEDGVACEGHECECTSLDVGCESVVIRYRERFDKFLCEQCWEEESEEEESEEEEF